MNAVFILCFFPLNSQTGTHKMQLISGGDGIIGGDTLTWFKFGKMVFISCAVWDFTIVNSNNDIILQSLPFICRTIRSIGTTGYNSTKVNFIPVASENNKYFSFAVKNPDGSTVDVKGNQFPMCTIQFNLIYRTEQNGWTAQWYNWSKFKVI